jgi:hypothetical protein
MRAKWVFTISIVLLPCVVAICEKYSFPVSALRWWKSWHAWPGSYVAILGALAFVMPFLRKDPSKVERALCVLGAAVLLFLELRSLKQASDDTESIRREENVRSEKARRDEDERFDKIASGLQVAIDNGHKQFENGQRQFEKTMSVYATLLDGTTQAANAAKGAIDATTGGDSWGYVKLEPDYEVDQVFPKFVLNRKAKYPMKSVQIIVVDYHNANAFYSTHKIESALERYVNQFTKITELPIVPLEGTRIAIPCGIDPDGAQDKNYDIMIHAPNGNWNEYLRFRKIKGIWHEAIRVVKMVNNHEQRPDLMNAIDPVLKKNGKMNWYD